MSKLDKSIKNAKVTFGFYFVFLIISFVSRKVFIESLGTELVGLSGTIQNILTFLNLAELGVYSAVTYSLYKPLVDKNHEEINKIISLFGHLYRLIGYFITVAGVILSAFLPLIFKKSEVSMVFVYGSYITFLTLTLISYFNNYRQILLAADQRNYTVTRITNYITISKVILQIIILKYFTNNYLIWLGLEFISGFIIRYITNQRVKKDYPWLSLNLSEGKKLIKEYPAITRNIKNIFIHKIADFASYQSTQLFIYAFTTLSMVTHYTNYTMITRRISTLIISTLSSNTAGIGHVIAEGNTTKTLRIFDEINVLPHFLAGIFSICFFYLTEPFIVLWLGSGFILPRIAFYCILFDFFIVPIRVGVGVFKNGYGLYNDVWAAITEGILNIIACTVGGYFWGLTGILIGGVIASYVIQSVWRPYFLFSRGFKISVFHYWKRKIVYLSLFAISILIFQPIKKMLPDINSVLSFIINGIIIFAFFAVVYGLLMYFFTPETKMLVKRLSNKFFKKTI